MIARFLLTNELYSEAANFAEKAFESQKNAGIPLDSLQVFGLFLCFQNVRMCIMVLFSV